MMSKTAFRFDKWGLIVGVVMMSNHKSL